MEFQTQGGRVLHLQPCAREKCAELRARFLAHPPGNMGHVESAAALFAYCFGRGVVDDPPAEDLPELAAIGFTGDDPQQTRAAWLSMTLGDEEKADLATAIVYLSLFEETAARPGD